MGFLSAVQRNLKVDEATSSKDDVTPVYILEELHEMAQNGQDVPSLVDYIIKRLQHRSPIVKQKTLRLIKYITSKRAPEFKRLMGRHAGAIRELTHYRGEPDPFKGDVPNQRVREYAKETLDVLFAAQEAPTYTAQAGSNTKGRIQGFGSTAAEPASNHSNVTYGSGGGGGYGGSSGYGASGGGGSSSKYVGFGNPMMEGRNAPPPSAAATVTATFDMAKQWVTSAGQAVGLTVPSKPGGARTMLGEERSYGGYGNGYSNGGYDGGGYSAPGASHAQPTPLGIQSQSGPYGHQQSHTRTPQPDGADEEGLVDAICRPGGLRPQPEKQDLVNFVEGVSILDGSRVALLLEERMEAGPWQASLRALCAVEAVVQQGASTSCGEIAVYFQGNPQAIQQAAKSTQASLRIRANAVLQLLGAEGGAGTTTATTAKGSAPEASLLDFGDDATTTTTTTATGNVIDLLSGNDVQAPPAVATTTTAAAGGGSAQGLFDGLDTPTAPPDVGATADLFGGMTLGGSGVANGMDSLLVDTPSAVPSSTGGIVSAGSGQQPLSAITDLLPPSPAKPNAPMMGQQQQQMMMMMGGFAPGTMPVVQQPPPGATMVVAPNGMPVMPGGMVMPGNGMMMPQMPGMPNGMMMHPGMVPNMMAAPQGGIMPNMMMGGAPQPTLMMQQGATLGNGPVPLEAFHTNRPTPIITPHSDDKFDFVNSMISSSNSTGKKGMGANGLL